MIDSVDSITRGKIMARIPSKNTSPEIRIRKQLFSRGFRYRLHVKKLPGQPDIVLPKYKSIIFVHGCLWHWHGCNRSRMPSSNSEYWNKKIYSNQERDERHVKRLMQLGWRVLIVWECSLAQKKLEETMQRVCSWIVASDENLLEI